MFDGSKNYQTISTIITGPLQAGKTTLMGMLRERLAQKGEKTLYLNLDVEWDRPHFESQQALINKVELELGKKKGFVSSMRSFIKKYEPLEAVIINLDLKKSIKIGKTRLTFLPYYEFMFKTL